MIVKKFQGATETEAIMKAKDELGSKAVVLNVKTLKQRGILRAFKKDVVEITAALEEEEFINGINNRKNAAVTSQQGAVQSVPSGKINLVADEKVEVRPETIAIEQKLDSLHNLLQSQIISSKDTNGADRSNSDIRYTADMIDADVSITSEKDPKRQVIKERENSNIKFLKLIYKKLIDNEVDEKYANQIIGDIEGSLKNESNIDSILAAIYQKIILKLGEPVSIKLGDKPKVVFFIGPTGVGKTTTIAKLASLFKLEEHARVAFITSDTYRVAAVEQLNTYASILDSPISVVYSADELEIALNEYADYDLIMVDTAGRSHHCEKQMSELTDLLDRMNELSNRFEVEKFLTLSVTTKYKDMIDITERYRDVQGWSLVFTKLDETCCLGNILNIKMLTDAPLSYTTSGQNVPNDIEIINEQAIAKQLLGGSV